MLTWPSPLPQPLTSHGYTPSAMPSTRLPRVARLQFLFDVHAPSHSYPTEGDPTGQTTVLDSQPKSREQPLGPSQQSYTLLFYVLTRMWGIKNTLPSIPQGGLKRLER